MFRGLFGRSKTTRAPIRRPRYGIAGTKRLGTRQVDMPVRTRGPLHYHRVSGAILSHGGTVSTVSGVGRVLANIRPNNMMPAPSAAAATTANMLICIRLLLRARRLITILRYSFLSFRLARPIGLDLPMVVKFTNHSLFSVVQTSTNGCLRSGLAA